MTFLISGVKKSRSTQFGVVLTTLLVTSTFLFGGESVQADIGHTQSRRIAARSVAARIAEEL